jgi:hypothetical protein
VGHACTAESLVADQGAHIEDWLWAAMRALQESAELKKKLADGLRPGKASQVVQRLQTGARDAQRHAGSLRRLLGSLERQLEE